MAAPCKRWGHGVVLYENHMYMFGGSGNNSNPRSWEAIYIMNCETFEWERVCPSDPFKGNLPEPRDSHSSTKIGNNMYIFGGSNGNPPFNDMFAFNFTFRSWNKVNATGDVPLPREGHSAAAMTDRYIFIYGGWNGKTIYNNYYLFDTMTNIWRKVEPEDANQEPAARESHTCCLVKDWFYVFGGQGHNLKKKENYFNDFYKAKLTFTKNMERVSCHWEKVISKNNVNPPHRTSHSATVYKDRYIFIIGGEGYSVDIKDLKQWGDDKKEMYSEKDFDDDKAPPCFPKNDVWIYDTDSSYWSLLEAKNSELLLPRFTHSCCVYKDQFIIFGGLKDYKNAIDDLIVLTIDDEDYKADKNKKDIDLCNQCRRLFMVEGEAKTQRKSLSLTNEDLMLEGASKETVDVSHNIANQYDKLLSVQKKPKQAEIIGHFFQDQTTYITLENLSKISQMIAWPLAGVGLLIDNALLKKAGALKILAGYTKSQNKRFLSFTDDGEVWTLKEIYEVFLNMRLDFSHCVDYEQKDQDERERSHHEIVKSKYSANLKMGGLRLGDTLVYGSKTETSIIIGLMSICHNNEVKENEVLFASWGLKTEAKGNEEKRKKLVERLSEYFSEHEFSELVGKNTILILDLKKIELGKDCLIDELHFPKKTNDVLFKPHKLLQRKLEFPYKDYIDFSLKRYLEHFLFSPQTVLMKICLNGEEILQCNYKENLEKNKGLANVDLSAEIQDCLKVSKVFVDKELIVPPKPKAEIEIKEPTTISTVATILPTTIEMPIIIPNEPIIIEGENMAKEEIEEKKEEVVVEEIKQQEEKVETITEEIKQLEQGILLYADGRLFGRVENLEFGNFDYFDKKWKKKKSATSGVFQFIGALDVKDFLTINLLKTVDFFFMGCDLSCFIIFLMNFLNFYNFFKVGDILSFFFFYF